MAEPNPELEIVTIFESDDPVAFSLATSVLDEAGVEYAVVEDGRPGFGLTPMVNRMRRIQIPAYRKEQALELMDRIAPPDGAAETDDVTGPAEE
jgi:antitoxin (DNA-binding transcriptional repressor) of toxin-antitoxin stability system